jgi:hypothetical protein
MELMRRGESWKRPLETCASYLGRSVIGFFQHNAGHTFTSNERAWITAWMEKLLPKSPAN